MTSKLIKFLPPLLFFLFIIWLIIQANLDAQNIIMDIGHAIPWGDKIGHFMLFGTLALLINVALRFRQIKLRRRLFHLGSLIVFGFATLEEFTQLAMSTRTFDVVDMMFDLLGIGTLSSVAFRRFVIHWLEALTDSLRKNLLME